MSDLDLTVSPPVEAVPRDAGEVAVLTIDLGALARNWKQLAERAAPAECAAVLKADAYGLGLEPVMRALLAAGCRTFFVATVGEGARARAVSPDATLYVLNGAPPGSGPLLLSQELRPVLNSIDEIAEWAASASTVRRNLTLCFLSARSRRFASRSAERTDHAARGPAHGRWLA